MLYKCTKHIFLFARAGICKWPNLVPLTLPLNSLVGGTSSWTANVKLDTRYLCHFPTKLAEIRPPGPGTFSQDVWTYKISTFQHLQFQIYFSEFFQTFLDIFSGRKEESCMIVCFSFFSSIQPRQMSNLTFKIKEEKLCRSLI